MLLLSNVLLSLRCAAFAVFNVRLNQGDKTFKSSGGNGKYRDESGKVATTVEKHKEHKGMELCRGAFIEHRQEMVGRNSSNESLPWK